MTAITITITRYAAPLGDVLVTARATRVDELGPHTKDIVRTRFPQEHGVTVRGTLEAACRVILAELERQGAG
uniref:Uncharacterized protein n=1 Tax=uncultured prokaryote TaxID=198431 RepID=A0A0H5Q670_9ZZZZ|nr:hypothetical protein [uncultured prokaryote]